MDFALFCTTTIIARYYSYRQQYPKRAAKVISYALLQQQNAETSAALIDLYNRSPSFAKLAQQEGDLIRQRDAEDEAKLAVGIEFAKKKGVIDPAFVPEPYVSIDVLGKTPSDVAQIILHHVGNDHQHNVVVLVGLSGTGKGTTTTVLRQALQDQNRTVVTWSNGNIFRAVTLLAATWNQQQFGADAPFDADKTLTKENLAAFMKMLSFVKRPDTHTYDTRLQGLGLDLYLSEVQNTTLKTPLVSKNIPTVAQATQGEVILFAADAIQRMGADGIFVLLEGRAQTVNYVRTPHRFQLELSDATLIGKRRAAQRLMGAALATVQSDTDAVPTQTQIQQALDAALASMVKEIVQE